MDSKDKTRQILIKNFIFPFLAQMKETDYEKDNIAGLSILLKEKEIIITENYNYENPSLIIERNKKIKINVKEIKNFDGKIYEYLVYGIIGIINLLSGPYLIVIIEISLKGAIYGKDIFLLKV